MKRCVTEHLHEHRVFLVDREIALFVSPNREDLVRFVFRESSRVESVDTDRKGQQREHERDGEPVALKPLH
jgi:hypothetical protein